MTDIGVVDTSDPRARMSDNDLIVALLQQATKLGFNICQPGSIEAVRKAFPDCFAAPSDIDLARETYEHGSNDDIEVDDDPMKSESDNGVWVSAWLFIHQDEREQDVNDGDENDGEIPA